MARPVEGLYQFLGDFVSLSTDNSPIPTMRITFNIFQLRTTQKRYDNGGTK